MVNDINKLVEISHLINDLFVKYVKFDVLINLILK
jgi:hypothetical protein